MPEPKLHQPCELHRAPIARGLAEGPAAIEPDGGELGGGLIRGFAVITRGEALGHNRWIDATMLAQTVDAINAAGPQGVKCRFTHPGLSGDGMGKYLGRVRNARLDGDVVRADLHLAAAAKKTPDGDLADYVLTLAQTDPAAFGASIVFRHDLGAEEAFDKGHRDAANRFLSPDPNNRANLKHVRLKQLRAVDAVDEPAANPQGWFHRGDAVAADAESLVAYALGLDAELPEAAETAFNLDPDRVQAFVSRFLDRRGLTLRPRKEAPVPDPQATLAAQPDPAPPTAPSADPRTEFTAELKRFTDRFGAQGAEWFAAGKTFQEALELHAADLQTRLGERDKAVEALKERFAALELGEVEPVSTDDPAQPTAESEKQARFTRVLGTNLGAFAAGIKMPGAKN